MKGIWVKANQSLAALTPHLARMRETAEGDYVEDYKNGNRGML